MERIRELDALRGLAALAVVIYHIRPPWLPLGWMAVDVFFVLSGYLITAGLIAGYGRLGALGRFYRRRGLRIWPIYYGVVLALIAATPLLPVEGQLDAVSVWRYLTYTQELPRLWSETAPVAARYLTHTWSLAIEQQFYLLWPLVVWALGGRARRVAVAALVVLVGSVLARSAGVHWWTLPARADGLALGALLATFGNGEALRRARGVLTAVGLLGLGVLVGLGGLAAFGPPARPGLSLLALNVAAFAAVGLVAGHPGHRALGILRRPRLVALGEISYGLYLYHFVLLRLARDIVGGGLWVDALVLATSLVVARLSWRFIEQPLLQRGRTSANTAGPNPGRRFLAAWRGKRAAEVEVGP